MLSTLKWNDVAQTKNKWKLRKVAFTKQRMSEDCDDDDDDAVADITTGYVL